MDDDDLRRGQPSVHRKFDQATAVLTGDALLTLAFEILGNLKAPADTALEAVRVLSAAAGTSGLIAGQALDLAHSAGTAGASITLVERIHEHKTARLIAAAMDMGALISGRADADARARVRRAGLLAGSAFQIVDDLLDLEGDAVTLGKTPRKDVEKAKLTFPAVAGAPAAHQAASERIERALGALPEATGTPLAALMGFFAERRS
jgi:geranylgeranyl pyrophosphate synthase